VGFEPTVGFPTLDFESSALNRTQPPFLSFGIVGVNLWRAIITRSSEFAKAKHHVSVNARFCDLARDELAYAHEFDLSFSAPAAERIAAPLKQAVQEA
jgi:hypothetical protein